MTTENHFAKKYLGPALAVLALMMCTACSMGIVHGEAPLVRMNELNHHDGHIKLQLSIRNLNGVELNIRGIDFSLVSGEDKILTYKGPVDTSIVANGTETLPVDVSESATGRDLLDKLQNGDIKSLPYKLQGSINTRDEGTMRFEYEGHIFPVPGRPGDFR